MISECVSFFINVSLKVFVISTSVWNQTIYNTYELESENIIIILLSYYIGFYRQIIITYEAYIW